MDRQQGRHMAVIKPREIDDFSISSDITTNTTIGGYSSIDYGAIPTISMSDITLGNISINKGTSTTYTLGSGLSAQGSHSNAVWTTTAVPGTGINWNQSAIGATIKPSATISLKGEDADIDLNGKSMKSWMEKVEERLNILTPNPELEKEWDELRKLGERYRKLEKKCKEKAEVWKKLKSMPPPSQA